MEFVFGFIAILFSVTMYFTVVYMVYGTVNQTIRAIRQSADDEIGGAFTFLMLIMLAYLTTDGMWKCRPNR